MAGIPLKWKAIQDRKQLGGQYDAKPFIEIFTENT
jgi:hypothetical protein